MEKKPFSELEPEMRTGDLILFSGRYEESELIEKLEHSPWSHVGMIDPLTRMLVSRRRGSRPPQSQRMENDR